MTLPVNILQDVATYNLYDIGYIQNQFAAIANSNKRYDNFQTLPGQLGASVTFTRQPRASSVPSLVANFQATNQLKQTLTVNKQESSSFAYSLNSMIFNDVDGYMNYMGKSACMQIGTQVESDVLQNFISNTYRFYGDGTTKITTVLQLAQALAVYRNWGAAPMNTKVYLSDIAVPEIVNTSLNQFVLDRNNEEAMSWELGNWRNADFYESNLLREHTAGTAGQENTTMTFSSISADGVTLTLSGVNGETVVVDDKFQFDTINYLKYVGYTPSASPVQFRATSAGTVAGGTVTITVDPPLIYDATGQNSNRNLPRALTGSDTGTFLPSHKAGVIYSGDPLYLATPMLPEQIPYPTGSALDEESGFSMRTYYGTVFGKPEQGFVHDCIWGSTLVSENAMCLIFPLTQ